MIRVLKNNTASPVVLSDTGDTVPASGQLTIDPLDYGKYEGSADVLQYLTDQAISPTVSTLTANDGTFDLPINEGVRMIQGGFSRPISDGSDPTIKAGVTDATGTADYDKRLRSESLLVGRDTLGNLRRINSVVRGDGVTAVPIDGTVTVQSTFGLDASPDTFFRIINTGSAGCIWRITIKGTANDPSSPDRDLPDYVKDLTVTAPYVGDEIAWRDFIIQTLNADPLFRPGVLMKAQKAQDRAVVHIYSEAFSAPGEFYERPNVGDFKVEILGSPADGVVVVGFDNIISRSKPVSIFRDLDSPHRLGSFSIFGNVRVEAKELSDIFIGEALNGGSPDMRVAGSLGVPIDFTVDASINTDLFIENLVFDAQGNGLKYGQFLSKNTPLTNGIIIEIKSDNQVTTFPIIKSTEDFKNKWVGPSGLASNFNISNQAGADEMIAIFSFPNPFIIRVAGTFTTDDYIRIRIQDDLSSGISRLNFRAKGFEKEP